MASPSHPPHCRRALLPSILPTRLTPLLLPLLPSSSPASFLSTIAIQPFSSSRYPLHLQRSRSSRLVQLQQPIRLTPKQFPVSHHIEACFPAHSRDHQKHGHYACCGCRHLHRLNNTNFTFDNCRCSSKSGLPLQRYICEQVSKGVCPPPSPPAKGRDIWSWRPKVENKIK